MPNPTARPPRWLLHLAGLGLLGVFVGLAVVVAGGQAEAWDRAAALRLHGATPAWTLPAFGVLTYLGEAVVLSPLVAGVLAVLVVQRRYAAALGFALLTVGGGGPSDLVKFIVARSRPQLWPDALPATGPSFPSGHATFMVIVVAALALVAFDPPRGWPARVAVGAGSLLLCLLVGLSRVVLGVHYPLDILAGFALGGFWVYLFLVPFRASWSPAIAGARPQLLGAAVAFGVFFASRWVRPTPPLSTLPASLSTAACLALVGWAVWLRVSAHWASPLRSGALRADGTSGTGEAALLGTFLLGAAFCLLARDLVLLATFVVFFALWCAVVNAGRSAIPPLRLRPLALVQPAWFPAPRPPALARLPLALRREADVLGLSAVGIYLVLQREHLGVTYPMSLREGTWYLVAGLMVAAFVVVHRRSGISAKS